MNIEPNRTFTTVKDQLGEICFLDYSNVSINKFAYLLGNDVKTQVHSILYKKLVSFSQNELLTKIEKIQKLKENISIRLKNESIDIKIRTALEEYMTFLFYWGKGISLHTINHPRISLFPNQGEDDLNRDLALLLQDEKSGCQTGIFREQDGTVTCWHTEEEAEEMPKSRFDKLRLVAFQIDNLQSPVKAYSFIYPDLLPGPAINWRSDGFVQAVDYIYLDNIEVGNYLLSNIICWITLRLGKSVYPVDVVKALMPYSDGYSITYIYTDNHCVQGRAVDFAGNCHFEQVLGFEPYSYLFHVNMFSENATEFIKKFQSVELEKERLLKLRIKRTEEMINKYSEMGTMINNVPQILCSTTGGGYAYANIDVKANFLIHITPDSTRVDVGSGPREIQDEIRSFFISTQ